MTESYQKFINYIRIEEIDNLNKSEKLFQL